jgi:hypothetical protein
MLGFCRDVSGVELLMNNHQSLKAEIDAREDNFTACISLGKELLSRNHYASSEIKEKLVSLTNQRNSLLHRWEERWENLQLSRFLCNIKTLLSCLFPSILSAWWLQGDHYGSLHKTMCPLYFVAKKPYKAIWFL